MRQSLGNRGGSAATATHSASSGSSGGATYPYCSRLRGWLLHPMQRGPECLNQRHLAQAPIRCGGKKNGRKARAEHKHVQVR